MLTYPNERLGIFIDAPNLNHALRILDFQIDFFLLKKHFAGLGQLLRCYYYVAVPENQPGGGVQKTVDWLEYNGWAVVQKPVKQMNNYAEGTFVRKGNLDIEIAVDMLTLSPNLDHLILFSGDGDFSYLVEALQTMGKRVTVACTMKGDQNGRMFSDELRRAADNVIELEDLKPLLSRNMMDHMKGGRRATASTETQS